MAMRVPMRLARRIRNPVMPGYLHSGGTDGVTSLSPFRGSIKRPAPSQAWESARRIASKEPRTLLWILLLSAACLATASTLFGAGYGLPPWWQFLALALVTAAAERQSVRLARNVETSVAFLPFVFTAVAFGPLSALAVGVVANALDLRRPYLRWAIYIPARGLTGAVIGLTAAQVITPHASFGTATLATVGAGIANLLFDSFFNVGTLLVRRSAPVSVYTRSVGPLTLLSLPLYVPLVALMVFGYQHYSFWPAAMFLGPTLALQRVVHLYQRQRDVSDELAEANERLEAANISFAAALVTTLDARDRYTAGHSAQVATYARDIAGRLGLSEEEQRLVHLCGLVHDIGKVGLPPGLLEKPGPLSLEERRQMERHPVIGERILAKVDGYVEIARIVRHHHERVDGQGYPDGFAADEIPLLSRIIAVADAYDAMTSDRPYRGPMPSRVARLRLAQAVGSQFDTNVVVAFEALLAGRSHSGREAVGEALPELVGPRAADAA
jgi:putative nucleotidyltransferase with HDIG domain